MNLVLKVAIGLLFTFVIYTFDVYGETFYNGLSRNGVNVYSRKQSKRLTKTVWISTVEYSQYTTSCGFLGWARCKRSRTKKGYKSRVGYYIDYDTYLYCRSGWRRSGSSCTIPICSSGCRNGGRCTSPNSCTCADGWTGSDCSQDINDCLRNNGGCQHKCYNKPGRGVICHCNQGYRRYGNRCYDVDECRLRACSCAVTGQGNICGATCTNTPGSFSCSCGQGYSLVYKTVCRDVDECANSYGSCSHQCVNFAGGYTCSCRRGFRLVNSKTCKDVNECDNNNGYCQHTCQNLYGGHRCKCKEGFTLDSNKRTCSDVDECKLYHMHGCQDHCNNTLGGYYCSCSKGYKLTRNNRTCEDINECAPRKITGSNDTAMLSTCHHICSNVEGSFQCSCREGYMLMYDKKRCKDIDECQTGQHSCEHNCHNTDGSYRCTCKAGYKLSSDGRTCEGQPCENISPPWQGIMTCFGKITNTNCTFSCNPGYDLVGSKFRTCLPSSRWSGNQTSCKAKHCETLATTRESETLSVPCFTSLGSTCYFGCRPGFVLKGKGLANCSLSSNGNVSWKTEKFNCQEINTCKPNPCRHKGKCLANGESSYSCNCEETGYKGKYCQIGFITTPVFPKLRPNISSEVLHVLARPSQHLRVSFSSEDGVKFNPLSIEIQYPRRKGAFIVEVEKPGIRTVTYTLEGEHKADFESTGERGVVFVASEVTNPSNRLYLLKGELPIGCMEHETNEHFVCELRLLSTAPWTRIPLSTNGIVHLATSNNDTIPLSLIGLNLSQLNMSRDEIIDIGIAKTSTSKNVSILHQISGTCYSQTADSDTLLKIIQNDAFVSSLMEAFSRVAPDWLTLAVSETNEYFDIQNIAVSLASNLEQCSGFPSPHGGSSLAYYRPAVSYKIRIAQNEVPLFADGKTCFALNVCKPGLFIRFPRKQADILKSSLNVFRDMKDCCEIDLTVNSIGFTNSTESSHSDKGAIWNGIRLHKLSSFRYNIWLKGSLHWRMEIPKLLFVTFKITGEAFIKSNNLDGLFTDRMSERIEMQFKGKAFLNITARALRKDFSLELDSTEIKGMAAFGGQTTCNKTTQGIFIAFKRSTSTRRMLHHSPLLNYIVLRENEPAHLAILMNINGGRQNKILNIGKVKLFLKDLRTLIPKAQTFISKASSVLPDVKAVLEGSLEKTKELSKLVQDMVAATGPRIDVARALALLNQINSKTEYLKRVIEHITPLAFSSNDFSLLRMIFEIQPTNFPKPLDVSLGGEHVKTNLKGISFYFRNDLCIGQLCFNDLSTTVDYLAEKSCFPSELHLSKFRAKGKALNTIPLSDGEILTLSGGQVVDVIFPRESDTVSAHVVAQVQLFGVKQSVNVTLDTEQLSFQMKGHIFNKYMTNMKVTADTHRAQDWRSLIFAVDGKMMDSSPLSTFLQERVINLATHLAHKAAKRVQNCKQSLQRAKQKVDSTKKLVEEKISIFEKAKKEKLDIAWQLQNIHNRYKNKKTEINSSLTEFVELTNNETCEIQNCSYIMTDTCIPGVCQEKQYVNYTVPNCEKKEEYYKVPVIKEINQKVEKTFPVYEVKRHSNCGDNGGIAFVSGGVTSVVVPAVYAASPVAGTILFAAGALTTVVSAISDALFGCDEYVEKVKTGEKTEIFTITKNRIGWETKTIEKFECGQPKNESFVTNKTTECCLNEVNGGIEILDPKCIRQNLNCLDTMLLFTDEIKRLNETLFEDFQAMRDEGEQAVIAQTKASKARVKFDVASKQVELARARLKQNQFVEESINLTKIILSEQLGLKLGEKMKNSGDKKLVTVNSLAFSVSMTRSSTKTRLPLTAYVKTFEDFSREIQFSMDFKNENDSLTLASRSIVEALFGKSHSRRRRSSDQDLAVPFPNSSYPLNANECLFAHNALLFFQNIIESQLSAIKSKRRFQENMSSSIQNLEKIFAANDIPDILSGPRQQIRGIFNDTIQPLKDAQLNSSGQNSWNDALDEVRGFLDILPRKKNFSECSGVQDCTDFFFDRLADMYEMEYHPRAIEIKAMLQSLEKIIKSMLKTNHNISTLEDLISQGKELINNSTDDIILCGKKPKMEKNSPVHVTGILGEAVHLECKAKSALEVEYLWIKDDQPLDESNLTILELRNVTKQSEGAYKCQASNRRGSTMSNITIVEVHQRPNITEQPRDARGLAGDEIFSIVCNSTGIPRPITEWFFIPIKTEKHKVVRVNTTTPYLTISNMTTANAGFYYCNVSNMHGTVQSRMARLDVLRFVPGVPRMAVSVKLKQCMFEASSGIDISRCEANASREPQQEDFAAFEIITQKMLERVNWPVERINNKYYNPFPDAAISFVVNGDVFAVSEGDKHGALNSFSQSRRRMGNDLKKLFFALQDENMKLKQKNLTISGDAESLVFGFLPQLCPNGTRRHENGFICVYCPPGSYGVTNGTCLQCPVGTYQPDEGRTECVTCPFRLSYTEPGAVRKSQCVDISIPCRPPEVSIKNAQVPTDMRSLYRSGDTVVFGCKPGYKVVGNGTQECNEGNWTKLDYYCEKTCYPPWTELKNRCYRAIESPTRRWKDALTECEKLGSQMVTISSEEENRFTGQLAKVLVKEKKLGQVQMWLGLRKLRPKDQFQWVDGSPLGGYTNWAPQEPNNANGQELCSEMLVSDTYWLNTWNDVKCIGSLYKSVTVCEKPLRETD